MKLLLAITVSVLTTSFVTAAEPLVYQGTAGVGSGKHIVFLANDHEYRSEQTCPALAKVLAKHHGFRCTVLFGIAPNGMIKPGDAAVPGMDALKDADLLVFFTRFMNLPDDQVDKLVDYFERGGPVVGIRTSTHCFNGQKGKWQKLNFNYTGEDYRGGLGEQIFGNTWHKERGQSHYGENHVMGSRITPTAAAKQHPILSGVRKIHAYSGGYKSQPPEGATPLLDLQVLNTFDPSDDINKDKPIVCAGWTRDSYTAPSGTNKDARVVYTSFGASEDLLSEDARRFLVNSCLWAGGMESKIRDDLNVGLVGGYTPSPYTNGMFYFDKVKPADIASMDGSVMPEGATLCGIEEGLKNPKKSRRIVKVLSNRTAWKAKLVKLHPGIDKVPEKGPAPKRKQQKKQKVEVK